MELFRKFIRFGDAILPLSIDVLYELTWKYMGLKVLKSCLKVTKAEKVVTKVAAEELRFTFYSQLGTLTISSTFRCLTIFCI